MTAEASLKIVQEWITGERSVARRIFFAESSSSAAALAERMTDEDALLAPADHGIDDAPGVVVSYEGRLDVAGGEFVVSEQPIEVLEYVAAAFVDVVVPTAVRLDDLVGWRAFIDDADLARSTGVIPVALTHPGLVLADRAAFEAPDARGPLASVYAHADGRVTMGPQGAELGMVDQLDSILASSPSRLLALAGAIPVETLFDGIRERPWIERYLYATDVARVLRLEPGRDLIGGFGCSLVDDQRADADPMPDDPFLVVTGERLVLAHAKTLRRYRLDVFTARLVEIVQTSTELSLAASRVAADASIPVPRAAELCREATAELGVRLGRVGADVTTAGRRA